MLLEWMDVVGSLLGGSWGGVVSIASGLCVDPVGVELIGGLVNSRASS